jgi:hypothetical protein
VQAQLAQIAEHRLDPGSDAREASR